MALNAGMFPFLAAHSAAFVALAAALADFIHVINYAFSALGACLSAFQVTAQAITTDLKSYVTLAAAVDTHTAIGTDESRAYAFTAFNAVVCNVAVNTVALLAAMVALAAVADPVVGNKSAAEVAIALHLPSVRRGGQHSQHEHTAEQEAQQLLQFCFFHKQILLVSFRRFAG